MSLRHSLQSFNERQLIERHDELQVLLLMEAMATDNVTHLHETGQTHYTLQLQRSGNSSTL